MSETEKAGVTMRTITNGSVGALALALTNPGSAMAEPVKVKVFIGVMFEIGENAGDRAGE